MTNNNDAYFWLSIVANIAQLIDFQMNTQQLSNDDLMRHLLDQDKVLDYQNNILQEQTNNYLEKIIEQNKKIIEQNKKIEELLERRWNK